MISKNQSKKSDNLNQQIVNLSSKLGQLRKNQNQCNSNFRGIEKTVSDYKVWSESRKTLIRGKIENVQSSTHVYNMLVNHPDLRNFAPGIRERMIQECKLPN